MKSIRAAMIARGRVHHGLYGNNAETLVSLSAQSRVGAMRDALTDRLAEQWPTV